MRHVILGILIIRDAMPEGGIALHPHRAGNLQDNTLIHKH